MSDGIVLIGFFSRWLDAQAKWPRWATYVLLLGAVLAIQYLFGEGVPFSKPWLQHSLLLFAGSLGFNGLANDASQVTTVVPKFNTGGNP